MEKSLPFHQQLKYEREHRGWSQADLAEKLGADVKTVGRWERGERRPQPFFRQKLIEVFEKKDAEVLGLSAGKAEEPAPSAGQETVHLEDWGEAPHIPNFYGRENEIATLEAWISGGNCRIVAILGMGGLGKTSLCAKVVGVGLAPALKAGFERVFWRSLQNAPPVESILQHCLQLFSHPMQADVPAGVDEQISLLIQALRQRRCLLVLDNYESILQTGGRAGHCRASYEGYGRLLQRVGEAQHQSCLVLTSREKPREVAHLEGKTAPVKLFHLTGVEQTAGLKLLQDKELFGADEQWANLIRLYAGNPLALQLVSESIHEVFGGDIAHFLAAEELAFGDINDLIQQHFSRLSALEREILSWLAIEREHVALEAVRENLARAVERGALLEAFNSLRRRSLIEARDTAHFTLQPVIMEFVTTNLVERASAQFEAALGETWRTYTLMKAESSDYIRDAQRRLILAPVAQRVIEKLGKEGVELQARRALAALRQEPAFKSGYAASNMLHLLVHIGSDLRHYDFSRLLISQARLQNVALPHVNFSQARFQSTIFTGTFGNILSVAFNRQGQILATGTTSGEIWLYRVADGMPLKVCRGHSDGVWSLAFHADGRLASSSDDQTIRLWDVSAGACLKTLSGHANRVRAIALHPDGRVLASGSDDYTVRLWHIDTGQCFQILQGHSNRVWSVAFNPRGDRLATGSTDQSVRLWDAASAQCLTVLHGHSNSIRSVVYHPDGQIVASGSDDQTIRLWDVNSGQCLAVLQGHSSRVWSLAYHPTGDLLASGSEDRAIRLWQTATDQNIKTLQEHAHGVRSVSFTPDGVLLASGGDDQTVRLWDIATGRCLKTLQGYTNRIWSLCSHPASNALASCSEDQFIRLWNTTTGEGIKAFRESVHAPRAIAFCPDGETLATGGEDQTVRIWEMKSGRCVKTLSGHTDWVRCVAFHPAGSLLASGSEDQTIRLWDTNTGACLHVLVGHTSWLRSVAFNFDGSLLASAGDDQTIRLWQSAGGNCVSALAGHSGRVRCVAFHPTRPLLASGSEDQTIRLWQSETGACLNVLHGHAGWVRTVAFSPSMDVLASSGDDQTIRLWDSQSGICLAILAGHTHRIRCLTFDSTGAMLASCSDDGTIRCWNIQTSQCDNILITERPYEGMNMTRAEGLSEAQKVTLRMLGAIEDE